MNESLVGTKLGQYELHAPLGQGGMATVYRAVQSTLNRSVAIKVLPLSRIPDPTLPARFRREAQLAASLLHPNVVPVYDFGEWEGYLYIVMALVAGGTLKDRTDAQLPVEAVVRLVGQVADALSFAHAQGIYHRDVKPTNVLLERADWAMLGDFGIARAIGDMTRLTSPYGTIGTPAYMAPEQWLGGDIDGRADLYSLGVVLYQLLTGGVPFAAPTSEGLMRQHLDTPVPPLASRRQGLPSGLEDVVQTALAKAPDLRYRHAGEFKAALEAATRHAQAPGLPSPTDLAPSVGPITTNPHLGQTYRVAAPEPRAPEPRAGKAVPALIVLVLLLVVLLAGAIGYIAAGGRLDTGTPTATPTTVAAATQAPPAPTTQFPATQVAAAPTQPPPPTQPRAPTPTTPPVAPKVVNAEPTSAPPTATQPPPPAPMATTRPAVAQPTAPAKVLPTPDPRFALVERHVGDYFAALNAGDYPRAQAVCCTPGWRARYPLAEWQRNFAGVTDLRYVTPFRYPAVDANRIVAEVDYSFTNSSGARRFFTLRWTFVPVGSDWLADEATASPQR